MLEFIKGCTIQLEITVDENITNWEIKAKLYDVSTNSILLATAGVGGSIDEIEKTEIGSTSKFVVKIPHGTTFNWHDNGYLEIKIDTGEEVGGASEILRGYKGQIKFIDSELNWDE